MALTIKNPLAEKLAREITAETGESLTQAVLRSLEERLERLRRLPDSSELVEALLAISVRCSSLPDLDTRPPEEILEYDEFGLFDR